MKSIEPDPMGPLCPVMELPVQACAHCRPSVAPPSQPRSTLTAEQEILIMAALKAPTLTLEEKQDRVFAALADGAQLTKPRLCEITGLSSAQVTQGWRALRGQPDGHMWVMEPHREHTLYYAAQEYEPMLRYQLWQARRDHKAAVALQASVEQMTNTMQRLRPDNGLVRTTVTAMKAATSAVWGFADVVRQISAELAVEDELVEKWLAVPNGSAA